MRSILILTASLLLIASESVASMESQFTETTQSAGFTYIGPTWGASWGDFDGDGWPDLWTSNHGAVPTLYRNLGDGTFTIWNHVLVREALTGDTHGAAWADFDNDGDQDLLQMAGGGAGIGSEPNFFFVNENGLLVDRAVEYQVDYPLGRGRTPLWCDWNFDGLLDVILLNTIRPDGQAPTAVMTQQGNVFIDDTAVVGLTVSSNTRFAQLTRLSNTEYPTILLEGRGYPESFMRYDSIPWMDVAPDLRLDTAWSISDAAVADFDGNGLVDVYLTRGRFPSSVAQPNATTIWSTMWIDSDEKGFSFEADGPLELDIQPQWRLFPEDIYIGSDCTNPTSNQVMLTQVEASGLCPHEGGVDYGVYVGFDEISGLWQITASHPTSMYVDVTVTTPGPISGLARIGFDESSGELEDGLFRQYWTGFLDAPVVASGAFPTQGHSVAAGDLDNDMDIDLYLVCRASVVNKPNILLENVGGVFQVVPDAGGALGSTQGMGESAAVADYDRDGFLDIFVTNGSGRAHYGEGPHQMFHNEGNGNHWLEIDLRGSESNRDGIGARVRVTAGGVTQMKDHGGGMHAYTQDHMRMHFGLADNLQADSIEIDWPSGTTQELYNVPADQILEILEPADPNVEIFEPPGTDGAPADSLSATGLQQIEPNPFNQATEIPFTLESPAHVDLIVYAMTGRLVRNLLNETFPAGEHRVVWDGRDRRGIPVSSGLYVVTLRVNGKQFSRKSVVVR